MEFSEDILPFDSPGGRQMAAWTLRLAADEMFGHVLTVDQHLWALFYAACAGAVPPPDDLRGQGNRAAISQASDRLLSTLKDLQRQFGTSVSGRFTSLYLDGLDAYSQSSDFDVLQKKLDEWLRVAEAAASSAIMIPEKNVDYLQKLLQLAPTESQLLLFQLYRHAPGFSQLYDILLRTEETTAVVLGKMFNSGANQIYDALSDKGGLVRSGLLSVQEMPLRIEPISPFLRATLYKEVDNEEDFMNNFLRPMRPKATTASLARLDDRDQDILLRLLAHSPTKEQSLNSLVYGPKSVDKRDMLARLFDKTEIDGWEVIAKKVPPSDLAAWAYIAQHYLEREEPDATLVIDHAEQILTSRRNQLLEIFGFSSEDDMEEPPIESDEEQASDEGLTASSIRCVWLTDHAKSISERNLAKFLFHCEARPGSRHERRERVSQAVSEFGLSSDLENHLSKYSLLGEHQVRQAATLARILALPPTHKDDASHEHVIRRAVHQSQKALGRDRTEGLRDSVTKYSLDYLNIAGRFTPAQIIKALRENPKGSICFHGLPGSGKTQLAEHIAVELDLPILMRSASDILSMWLGNSEKNIAAMFSEAESEGALLFLDEADSFLRDRVMAREAWSVTQVNEMLQKIERFDGVFIAATNLMDSMDAASLRRFTWKLEFLPLKNEQAWEMFCNESGLKGRSNTKRAQGLKDKLAQVSDLAPGDFATVKRQANMLGEQLDPEAWIEQLAVEAKAKMAGLRHHRVGFEERYVEPTGKAAD